MSTPQQQPHLHNRNPSKSSLRRTSGPQNSSQRSLLPQPSPRFEDNATTEVRYSPRSPPNQTLEYDSNEDDDDDDDDGDDALIKRDFDVHHFQHHEGSYFPTSTAPELEHPFEPLFTLIEDNLTSEHYHPSVHYIFADDDQEIITEAAVRSLEEDELDGSSESASGAGVHESGDIHDAGEGRLLPKRPGVKEHYLILDVQPSDVEQPVPSEVQSQVRSSSRGPSDESMPQNFQSQSNIQAAPFAVASFTSLSPDWQIQTAIITSAPTMSEATTGEDEGLMLRIEGRGFAPIGTSEVLVMRGRKGSLTGPDGPEATDAGSGRDRDYQTLEGMIDRFQNNLNDIRKLIEMDLPGIISQLDLEGGQGGHATNEQAASEHHQSFDFEAQD